MKFIKMLHPLPLLLSMLLAVGSFVSVDTSVLAASGGAVKPMSAEEAAKPMKDEYFYKETNDMLAVKFMATGIAVALFFTLVSIATGAGRNKG